MIQIGDGKIRQFINNSINVKLIIDYNKGFLNGLKKIPLNDLNQEEKEYLKNIIAYFKIENFLLVEPEKTILTIGKTPSIKIKNLIIEKSNYKKVREEFLPYFFNFLGIKTCVYCHSQLALVFKKQDDKYKALLEADHYFSKSSYPYLSISLYNLYPVCSNCNRNKSKKKIHFKLYSNEPQKVDLEFKIKDKSIVENFLNFDASKLELEIIYDKDYIDTFYLNEIYHTQIDVVEELVYKSKVYNSTYRENLRTYGIDEDTINRFIVGNYNSEKDPYKRPLAKMMRDIAKDLELIR